MGIHKRATERGSDGQVDGEPRHGSCEHLCKHRSMDDTFDNCDREDENRFSAQSSDEHGDGEHRGCADEW